MTAIRSYIKCAICGIPFEQQHPNQKYCSDDCARRAHTALCREMRNRQKLSEGRSAVVKCAFCGIEFIPQHGNQKYCSQECFKTGANLKNCERYHQKVNENSNKVFKCEVCGEPFEPRNRNQKYCSQKCKSVRENEHAREKFRQKQRKQYPREKTCVECRQTFMAYHPNSTRCPKCQASFHVTRNIEYQHERYLRERTSDKPYQPQKNINKALGLTDDEYAFTPKPKKKPQQGHRSPEENHAIIDAKVHNANALHISYGEYDACLRQGIDPAAYAARRRPYQSYEERAWLDQILAITGKI